MPKDTFFNLPESKRKRIIDAAIDEFASSDFDQASVSRIVRKAGIAKGSFYQYFEDKMDLFMHVISLGKELKMEFIKMAMQDHESGGFFETFKALFRYGIEFAGAYPRHASIGVRITKNQELMKMLIDEFSVDRDVILRSMLQTAKESGEVRADLDNDLVIHVLSTLTVSLYDFLFKEIENGDFEEMLPVADRMIDILEHGLGSKK